MSEHLREMWRQAVSKTAMPADADFLGTLVWRAFETHFPGTPLQRQVTCKTPDGQQVGHLRWLAKDYKRPPGKKGEITYVFVQPEYQRRGVATEMLARARRIDPDVHHSGVLTEDGSAWSQVAASKTAALSGILTQSPTPLDYRGKFWGPSTRLYITDPDAPAEAPKGDYYFKDNPRGGFKAPTDPHTVAWLDIFEDQTPGQHWVFIAFMAVRSDYRGRGLSSRLIKHLYDTYPDSRIEWGTLVGDVTPGMYQRYKQTHPEQTGQGSTW